MYVEVRSCGRDVDIYIRWGCLLEVSEVGVFMVEYTLDQVERGELSGLFFIGGSFVIGSSCW